MSLASVCSVVVATSGRPAQLDVCLRSLASLDTRPLEVIVVGSGRSIDGCAEVAARWNASWVADPEGGASRARNLGARTARGEIIAFIDDDAVAEPAWLDAILAEFSDSTTVAVGGKIRPIHDPPETEAERLAAAMTLSHFGGNERLVMDRTAEDWVEFVNFRGVGIGPNMAFRRLFFERHSGFDERIGPGTPVHGGEEQLAFFRLVESGYRVVYTPAAVVRHPVPVPQWESLRQRHRASLVASSAYLTLLWLEYPQYRYRVFRYMTRRRRSAGAAPSAAVRGRHWLSYLMGPIAYARAVRRRKTRER